MNRRLRTGEKGPRKPFVSGREGRIQGADERVEHKIGGRTI